MRSGFPVAACVVAISMLTSVATAQQSNDHWSLEAMAAQARVVFRGTITEITSLKMEAKPNQPAKVRLTLTLRTKERIKGSPDSWMTLDRVTLATDARYDMWMKSKTELLWFRFSEDDPRAFPGSLIGPGLDLQPGQSWTAVHLDKADPAELAFDKDAAQASVTMDFKVLTEGKDKVEAVKKFLKDEPESAKVCRLLIPPVSGKALGSNVGPHYIVVPITPELEAIAMKMIASPETFLPKEHVAADSAYIRASGIKALANFKSDKNIALIKTYLTDTSKGPSDVTESSVKTYYWARLAAYNALTAWGVKVVKPALQG